MELQKSNTGNKLNNIISNFFKNVGEVILFGLFLTISVGCSTYVYFFENVTVDIQSLIGGVALMFSLLFAAMGRWVFRTITRETTVITITKMYWWLGCINLIVFLVYIIKLGHYPAGWMIKIMFLILMGGLNQVIIRYDRNDKINDQNLIIMSDDAAA